MQGISSFGDVFSHLTSLLQPPSTALSAALPEQERESSNISIPLLSDRRGSSYDRAGTLQGSSEPILLERNLSASFAF